MAHDSDRPDPNAPTPPRAMSPARRMLAEFEASRQQPPPSRRLGCAVAAAAIAVLLLAAVAGGVRPCSRRRVGAAVGPATPTPGPAPSAGGGAPSTGAVAAPDTSLAVAPPPPPPPVPKEPTVEHALVAWPAVLDEPLGDKACLEQALLCKGQYGGHFHIHNGGLAISGVHTNSACWWDRLVGDVYLVSLEFYFGGGVPIVLLSGPGYGSHPAVGYALHLPFEGGALAMELRRQGALLGLPLRRAPFQPRQWHRLDVLRDRGRIVVHLDGQAVGRWEDPEPLRGAMHAFVGLAAQWGMWGDDRPHYRNLAIRMPEPDAERLADEPVRRWLDPPIATPPQPNGDRLCLDDFAADGFERWTAVQKPRAVNVRNGQLVLQGPNAWPVVWRDEPIQGSAAVEFQVSYFPGSEALNFNARLRVGDYPDPAKKTVFRGWQLGYPGGNGQVCLSWCDQRGKGQVVAKTAYYPALGGRPYVLRFERSGRVLRVFVNDGFLLEAMAPEPVAADAAVTPGLYQIYGGSRVARVEAWRIPDLPGPGLVAGMAGGALDVGPRLAATGSFAAAFEDHVRPLLAARRYGEAAEALAPLGARPEFRLAAGCHQLAQSDVARLLRLQAAIPPKPDLATVKAADLLARLGPNFPPNDEARLQAALLLLWDKHGDPRQALALLDGCADQRDARRYRALARRALAAP